jgi:hypothetical protein
MNLTAYDKTRKVGRQVGAAWTNEDGTIVLALDPGTALIYDQNMIYKLWHRETAPEAAAPQASSSHRRAPPPARSWDDMDDDIPF